MTKITKDMTIFEVLQLDPECAPVFLNNGMHCLGCPGARGEKIESACSAHGTDPNKLLTELNEFFSKKQ